MNERLRIINFLNDMYPNLIDPFLYQTKHVTGYRFDLLIDRREFLNHFNVTNVRQHLIETYDN